MLVLGVMLVLPGGVRAQGWATGAVMLEVQGEVTASEAKANEVGYDAFALVFTKTSDAPKRWLAIVQATTWGGDSFQGKELMDNIVPQRLVIVGQNQFAQQLMAVPPGSRVHLEGMLAPGVGEFMLGAVRILSTP
jgi:hypothetical protein